MPGREISEGEFYFFAISLRGHSGKTGTPGILRRDVLSGS